MLDIIKIEIVDNKYIVTIRENENTNYDVRLGADEFQRLFNLFNTARIQSKGVVSIVEDAKEEIDINQKMAEIEKRLMSALNFEFMSYKASLSMLYHNVEKLIKDGGSVDKIAKSTIDKLTDVSSIIEGIRNVNQKAFLKMEDTEKHVMDTLNMTREVAKKTNEELLESITISRKVKVDSEKVDKAMKSISEQQEMISKKITELGDNLMSKIEHEVENELGNIRDQYTKYANNVISRETIIEEFKNLVLKEIAVNARIDKELAQEKAEVDRMIEISNNLLKKIEKDIISIVGKSSVIKDKTKVRIEELFDAVSTNPGKVHEIADRITLLLESGIKSRERKLHFKKNEVMQKIDDHVKGSGKLKILSNKIKEFLKV